MSRRALRVTALLILTGIAGAALGAAPRGEVSVEVLLLSLDLERKAKAGDLEDLERATRSLERAEGDALTTRNRLLSTLREGEADAASVEAAEDAIAEAEARAAAAAVRRGQVAARLAERLRRIADLSDELVRRRSGLRSASDPVTGRWAVVINPGGRRGTFRLTLDGALVSGDFVLEGGFRGSLRGTYVGERLTLQRIDSERGLDATFVGRLNPGSKRVVGTWNATQIAPPNGPTAGEWVANQLPDREDEDRQ